MITKKKRVICFLFLANMFVANLVYNLWTAEKDAALWESLTHKSAYYFGKLKKKIGVRQSDQDEYGVVAGTLCNVYNRIAVIDGEIVHEGDTVRGVKVVRIQKGKVEFENKGKRWAQQVGGRVNRAWREAD